jgi:hypothetical protein
LAAGSPGISTGEWCASVCDHFDVLVRSWLVPYPSLVTTGDQISGQFLEKLPIGVVALFNSNTTYEVHDIAVFVTFDNCVAEDRIDQFNVNQVSVGVYANLLEKPM